MYILEEETNQEDEPQVIDTEYQVPQFRLFRQQQEEQDESEIETLYVVVSDTDPRKSWFHLDIRQIGQRLMQVLALIMLAAFTLLPETQVYAVKTLVLPASFTTKVYQAESKIVSTGRKTYPAKQAHGFITIYNGAPITEQISQGFLLMSTNGQEVVLDETAIIPPANPPSLGVSEVKAHMVQAGKQGNIQPLAINQTYESALYLKNLSAFLGGTDSYTETFVTPGDKEKALENARSELVVKRPIGLLKHPCTETSKQTANTLLVTWSCQYASYQAPPNVQILSVQLSGDNVILSVKTIMLPQ